MSSIFCQSCTNWLKDPCFNCDGFVNYNPKDPIRLSKSETTSIEEKNMGKTNIIKNNDYILKHMIVDEFRGTRAYDRIICCKDCEYQQRIFHKDKRYKEGGYFLYSCRLNDDQFVSHVVNGYDDEFCSNGIRRANN